MTAQTGGAEARAPSAWFRGEGAVCGVGSLPFVDPVAAVRFVAEQAPEVPFWPQLRRMSPREAMIPQTLGTALRHLVPLRGEHAYAVAPGRVDRLLASLGSTEARLEPGSAAGFFALIDAFRRGEFPHARAIKCQAMGPVTVACTLLADGAPLFDQSEARKAIADHVVRLARWQAETMLRLARSVVLVLDEAYLGVALRQNPERREAIVDLLRSVILRVRRPGVLVGLHCCDRIPLSILNEVEPDLFSFDAHHGGDEFAADPESRRFLDGGAHVAWGWVPTLDDLSRVDAAAVALRWFEAARRMGGAEPGIDLERIAARSLVTASCGLAGSSEATCRRSFELAREISLRFARLRETS